ncbi:MAG: protein phosphatase 2C domain-containing protein [Myxococcales bacterium]|nr:protein phosphatase 2C domain-containing protein [Myxococcales bacterium]
MSLRILLTGRSEQHSRPSNQDRLYPAEEKLPASLDLPQCLAIADGMGGTQNGEFAAQIAVQDLPHLMHPERWSVLQAGPHQPPPSSEEKSPNTTIEHYFRYINQRIMQSAGGSGQSGTTLSLLYLDDERFWIGHIGDSRVYLYRQQGLTRLTRDDHALDYFEEKGSITLDPKQLQLSEEDHRYLTEHKLDTHKLLYLPDQASTSPLSPEALHKLLHGQVARLHQLGKLSPIEDLQDRLMRALGSEKAFTERPILQQAPEKLQAIPKPGDLFLLCTDGLWNSLNDEAIAERFRQLLKRSKTAHLDPALLTWCCDQLIEDAVQAGADDNITVLLGQILPSRSAPHTLSIENYPKDLKKILTSQATEGTEEDTEDFFQQPTAFDPVLIEDDTIDIFQQPTSFESEPATAEDFVPSPISKPAQKKPDAEDKHPQTITDIPSLPTPPKLSPPEVALRDTPLVAPSSTSAPQKTEVTKPIASVHPSEFAVTLQDNSPTPLADLQASLRKEPTERSRITAGTSFSPPSISAPASPTASKPLSSQERFVWIGLSGTLFLLCLIAWLGAWGPRKATTPPPAPPPLKTRQAPPRAVVRRPTPAPKPTPAPAPAPAPIQAPSGPWVWLPTQLQKEIRSDALQKRLRILQQLHNLHQDYVYRWGLPPETLRKLGKLLFKKELSALTFQAFTQRPPTPPQLQALDQALQQSLIASLEALAPSYAQKLDQMRALPPLPRSAPRFAWSKKQRKIARKELLQTWLKRVQRLGWKLWQVELLAEQLLDFPYPPANALQKGPWVPQDLDAIRRTTERLKKAMELLQQEDAKHALLPDLQNRLQIQEAWLKEATNKEKPSP